MMFGLVYIIPYFSQMLLSYWAMFFDWSDIVTDKRSILDISILCIYDFIVTSNRIYIYPNDF